MEILNAIILGIVQGLTEFLPISSSGHLEIAKSLLNEESIGKESMLMTITLHLATAFSTLYIFKNDVVKITKGLFVFRKNEEAIYSIKILLSMIPAALVGFFLKNDVEKLFVTDLFLVGIMLLITSILLFLADKAKVTLQKIRYTDSIIIGIAQAIAIIPGISRSGATIAVASILGVDKEEAAKFSFLMVVPLIFGAMINDLISSEIIFNKSDSLPLLFGFIAAFIIGALACRWMIKLVKKSELKYFAFYCMAVGLIILILYI